MSTRVCLASSGAPTFGWHSGLTHKAADRTAQRQRLSISHYYAYHLMIRGDNPLPHGPGKSRRKSAKNRSKIDGKPSQIDEKSMKNRRKFGFGWFWAFKAVSGTRRDAFGTRPGRARASSRAILGRPGRAKSGQGTSKSEPGMTPLNHVAPGPGF